jgi:hypothetical protein
MKNLKNMAIVIIFVMICFACLIPLYCLYQYAIVKDMEYLTIYNNVKDVAIYLFPTILTMLGIGIIEKFKR